MVVTIAWVTRPECRRHKRRSKAGPKGPPRLLLGSPASFFPQSEDSSQVRVIARGMPMVQWIWPMHFAFHSLSPARRPKSVWKEIMLGPCQDAPALTPSPPIAPDPHSRQRADAASPNQSQLFKNPNLCCQCHCCSTKFANEKRKVIPPLKGLASYSF